MTQVLEQAQTRVSDRTHDMLELRGRLEAITHELDTARTARNFNKLEELESSRSAIDRLCSDARASLEQAKNDLSDLEQQARDLEHRQEIARAKVLEQQAEAAYRAAFLEIVEAVNDAIPSLGNLIDCWQDAARTHHSTRQRHAAPQVAPEVPVLHNYTREFTSPSAVTVANGSGPFGTMIARELEQQSARAAERQSRADREAQRSANMARINNP
jgi:hypothetical protein